MRSYYYFSPRGFANEARILAARKGNPEVDGLRKKAYTEPGPVFYKVSRREALRLCAYWRRELSRIRRGLYGLQPVGPTAVEILD